MLEQLKLLLSTPEGMQSAIDFFGKCNKDDEILDQQLIRFHDKLNLGLDFNLIVGSIITKHKSDIYKNRYHKRSQEPPESLFWFLFEYAKKYGRGCDDDEYEKYGNMFVSGMYFINDFYIMCMNGQGSIILISEKIDY